MTQRAEILAAIQAAHRSGNGQQLTQAVAALEAHDRQAQAAARQQREIGYADQLVGRRFASGPMNGDRHTFATDWLGEMDGPGLDYRIAMRAEAAGWVRGLPREVLADREEFTAQALGHARTAASAYGQDMELAYAEFLRGVTAASGLPQIDQMIDPNNQPATTPYPTAIFPNFAPDQNEYNGGIEGFNHDSEISSRSAPMLEQLEQMNGGGSGFGTGPEKPDEHTTDNDFTNSYAEVPLGPPGTIPAGTPGQGPSRSSSTPTPVTGDGQIQDSDTQPGDLGARGLPADGDDDDDDRRKTGSLYYSAPDPHGFRWLASASEVYHPYHEACRSSHWPDEDCTRGLAHTASVAIDHSMTLDQARRVAACESIGAQEGQRALRASRGILSSLAAHHNRMAAAWGASQKTADDTAVLHGFQAVVRPVLAEASQGCSRCRLGATVIVNGKRLCGEHGRQERESEHRRLQPHTSMRKQAHPWTKKQRDKARKKGDTLPGTDKLPVESHQDLVDAEHLEGRVKGESKGKVKRYIKKMKKRYGVAVTPRQAARIIKSANKYIEKRGDSWVILQKGTGKVLSHHSSHEMAQKAFEAMEMHKHGVRIAQKLMASGSRLDFPRAAEAASRAQGASSLPQIQQVVDPNNVPVPQDDVLPVAVMFPITFDGQGDGQPGNPDGSGSRNAVRKNSATQHDNEDRCTSCGHRPGCDCTCCDTAGPEREASRRKTPMKRRADFMTAPHQTTDDFAPVPNSAATSPQPWSQTADPAAADYRAGFSEGQADAAAGQRPTFMDNSDSVSSYVKGYAEGYAGGQGRPVNAPDVPRSMGGDSGQARNSQQAMEQVQVAKASKTAGLRKVSSGFVSAASAAHPDFRKGYGFATRWNGGRLVAVGSPYFEAGLYAGISDRTSEAQLRWVQAHRKAATRNPGLADRIRRHASFSESLKASGYRIRRGGVYAYLPHRRTAGTTTDLITDGPGTSPDPMGSTPLNGPGTPPPDGGKGDPARPGGPSPYQGAAPAGAGPAEPDDVMGTPQEQPQPDGPLAQGFSGPGPGFTNQDQVPPSARGGPAMADLAPAAPNQAAQPGYSNPDAYKGSSRGGDRTTAFRKRVQSALAVRKTADLESDLHTALRLHKSQYGRGMHFSPDANIFDLKEHLRRMGRPAEEDEIRSALDRMQGKTVWPGAEWDTWSTAG